MKRRSARRAAKRRAMDALPQAIVDMLLADLTSQPDMDDIRLVTHLLIVEPS